MVETLFSNFVETLVMKILTSKHDQPLPLPGGRVLPANGKTSVEDHVAGMDRIAGWVTSQIVEVSDPPLQLVEEGDAPRRAKGKTSGADPANG